MRMIILVAAIAAAVLGCTIRTESKIRPSWLPEPKPPTPQPQPEPGRRAAPPE